MIYSWTPAEEEKIAALMKAEHLSRIQAIQKLRRLKKI